MQQQQPMLLSKWLLWFNLRDQAKFVHTLTLILIVYPTLYVLLLAVINECVLGIDNCDHVCTDTLEAFTCSCNFGYLLDSDGHSCTLDCGGRLTAVSGSFQTPGWPNAYPSENFRCEWIVDVPGAGAIEFTIDQSAFGINGNPSSSCSSDSIQFFNGATGNARSLGKICGLPGFYGGVLPVMTTTTSTGRVVFTGTDRSRPASRVGVKVNYVAGGQPLN